MRADLGALGTPTDQQMGSGGGAVVLVVASRGTGWADAG